MCPYFFTFEMIMTVYTREQGDTKTCENASTQLTSIYNKNIIT